MRFTIRGLLVIATISCVFLGVIAWLRARDYGTEVARDEIERLGGRFTEYSTPSSLLCIPTGSARIEIVDLYLNDLPITNEQFRNVRRFPQVEVLHASNLRISSLAIDSLSEMRNIKFLDLSKNSLHGNLAAFLRMEHLESLCLDETDVTDSDLIYLGNMSHLRSLSLNNTRVTDSGMRYLCKLHRLECLSLSNTHISDDGLEQLQSLASLNEVELDGTKITSTGHKQFCDAIGNVKRATGRRADR